MERVTGFGGLFFKAEDPEALYASYEKHLDLKRGPEGGVTIRRHQPGEEGKEGATV